MPDPITDPSATRPDVVTPLLRLAAAGQLGARLTDLQEARAAYEVVLERLQELAPRRETDPLPGVPTEDLVAALRVRYVHLAPPPAAQDVLQQFLDDHLRSMDELASFVRRQLDLHGKLSQRLRQMAEPIRQHVGGWGEENRIRLAQVSAGFRHLLEQFHKAGAEAGERGQVQAEVSGAEIHGTASGVSGVDDGRGG